MALNKHKQKFNAVIIDTINQSLNATSLLVATMKEIKDVTYGKIPIFIASENAFLKSSNSVVLEKINKVEFLTFPMKEGDLVKEIYKGISKNM